MFKKNKRKDDVKNLEAKVDRLERQLNSLATHLGCSGILTVE